MGDVEDLWVHVWLANRVETTRTGAERLGWRARDGGRAMDGGWVVALFVGVELYL